MRTRYYTATSIDGFLADPDGSLDWLFQFGDVEGMDRHYPDFLAGVGALAMGSATYEWIAGNTGFLDDPSAWVYEIPTWVFSHRELPRVEGPDIRFVSGDVRPVHAAMAESAGGRDLWLVGGGDLVGQFADAGLLDDLILTVAPVTLGAGAPLLPRRLVTPPLRLVGVERYGEVFATLRYELGPRRAG